MTPQIAAVTRPEEAVDDISRTIMNLESGQVGTGQVNRVRGY
ncbi:glyoxylate/hydroxypyruvate reductase GhrA, partial [Citrobacter portucalensis]